MYFMVKNASAADIIAAPIVVSGGDFHLFKNVDPDTEWDGEAYELTAQEARDAQTSHFFFNYDGLGVGAIQFLTKPMIQRDETYLTEFRQQAIGYFFAKDYTPAERAAKLVKYGPAVQMATAGSVEGTLDQLLVLFATETDPDDLELQTFLIAGLQDYLGKFPR
jgi:hypothetical protein